MGCSLSAWETEGESRRGRVGDRCLGHWACPGGREWEEG